MNVLYGIAIACALAPPIVLVGFFVAVLAEKFSENMPSVKK